MKNINLGKKLLIGFGTLAVISLIIGFAVSNASAKAEVKAREAAQVQQVKDTVDAALKVKQENIASYAKVVADAKIEADAKALADSSTVPETGHLFDLSVTPGTEEARIAKDNGDKVVQDAIANQKKATASNSTLVVPTPTIPTPTPATQFPVTSGVVENSIDGTFNGWGGDTIFQLRNGQIWQQSSFDYKYHYAYSPDVTIYQSGSGYKMKVDGVDSTISVTRIK